MEQNKQMPAAFGMIDKNFKNRHMILKLAKNDFRTKYAGSYLGIVWAFVQPITTILLYWFVFQVGFRTPAIGNYPFVLWLTAGLVPWFFFSDAWNGGTHSLIGYSFLVKKVVFDIEILPGIKVLSAFFVNLFFSLFMLVIFAANGYYPTIHTLQLLYCMICTFALTWALSYFTSALVVFVRDLGHLLSVILQILMWLTPIMWNIGMIEDAYPWLVQVMKFNPIFYVVQVCRDAMFAEKWFWQQPVWTAYFWGLTILLFVMGSHVFQKLRPHFADVL